MSSILLFQSSKQELQARVTMPKHHFNFKRTFVGGGDRETWGILGNPGWLVKLVILQFLLLVTKLALFCILGRKLQFYKNQKFTFKTTPW